MVWEYLRQIQNIQRTRQSKQCKSLLLSFGEEMRDNEPFEGYYRHHLIHCCNNNSRSRSCPLLLGPLSLDPCCWMWTHCCWIFCHLIWIRCRWIWFCCHWIQIRFGSFSLVMSMSTMFDVHVYHVHHVHVGHLANLHDQHPNHHL